MWLALLCLSGLCFISPDTQITLQKCFMMVTFELLRRIKDTRCRVQSCRNSITSLFDIVRENAYIIREIWSGYQAGIITRQSLTEFILFHIRIRTAQYLENGHVTYLQDKRTFDIVYYEGDRKCRIRFPKNRGVRQIVYAENSLGKDVTSIVLEFLGPGHNFHGIPTSPKLLGWEDGLVIQYRNGTKIKYEPNDEIRLTP